MFNRFAKYLVIVIMTLSLLSCIKEKKSLIDDSKPSEDHDEKHITKVISKDTIWEGKVTVDGVYKIAKGVKLTIKPGTTVEFTYHDYDKDGLGDSGLFVEGEIIATGSYKKPILFTSVKDHKESGSWGMILVNFSNQVIFDYCKFEYSTYTLHIHFSTGSITNSLFTKNEDGTRIGRSQFTIYNNVFKGNQVKGVNFTDSQNDIKYNVISNNKHGIFLFEGDKKSNITHNNIFNNKIYNFKLGDFFVGEVALNNNYWGEGRETDIRQKIFDWYFDATLSTVGIKPAKEKFKDTGIIKKVKIEKLFEFEADGYIDSSAAYDEKSNTIYFGSFDGFLYAIDASSGKLKFKFEAGDIIDSSPAIDGDNVYFASWNNNVYSINKFDGTLKWTYEMRKSEQDDHRQSSPVIKDNVLYIGGYDGTVYAIDVEDGDAKWKFTTKGAIRSKGVIDGNEIIFGSSDGTLYGISLKSGRGNWFINLGAAILATPLVLDDIIVASVKDGSLVSVDKKTKTLKKKFEHKSVNFYSAPILYKGDIIFATTINKLYRLKKDSLSV
ncbi:PQQ-binding-like beta-propeller repeat protein, partial [Thermodesulfobacteriota bacterium]